MWLLEKKNGWKVLSFGTSAQCDQRKCFSWNNVRLLGVEVSIERDDAFFLIYLGWRKVMSHNVPDMFFVGSIEPQLLMFGRGIEAIEKRAHTSLSHQTNRRWGCEGGVDDCNGKKVVQKAESFWWESRTWKNLNFKNIGKKIIKGPKAFFLLFVVSLTQADTRQRVFFLFWVSSAGIFYSIIVCCWEFFFSLAKRRKKWGKTHYTNLHDDDIVLVSF